MAVQQDLAAGIAAAEVRPTLQAGGLVDPAGLAGVAHLLQMPVQLLTAGLAAVEDGVVAHLAVGNVPVDLPAAVHLAVELALGLDALGVVLIDQADLRGSAHAAGDHVFSDDVGDVQQVDGLELRAHDAVPQARGGDHAMDLVQHGHHGLVAAGRAAEHLQALAAGTDGVVLHHDAPHLGVLLIGQHIEVALDGLGPALLGVADRQRHRVAGEAHSGVLQPLPSGPGIVGLVDDLKVGADLRQLLCVGLEHPHAHAATHHQQVEQIVVGVVIVDDLEGAVVVRHGIGLRHRRLSHPERAPGQELPQVVDVVVELFRFLAAGGRQGAVVLHGPAHRLPPELPSVQLGNVARVGAQIHKRAQLAHGIRRVLVLR